MHTHDIARRVRPNAEAVQLSVRRGSTHAVDIRPDLLLDSQTKNK